MEGSWVHFNYAEGGRHPGWCPPFLRLSAALRAAPAAEASAAAAAALQEGGRHSIIHISRTASSSAVDSPLRAGLASPLFSCGLRYTATTTIHKCTKVLQRKEKGKINICCRPALTVADWTFYVLSKDFHKFSPLLLPHDGCSVRLSFVLRRSGKLMCVWDDDRPPSIPPSPHVLSRKVPIAGSMKKGLWRFCNLSGLL